MTQSWAETLPGTTHFTPATLTTSRWMLLAVYLVIPASIMVVAADVFFGKGYLRETLPYSPQQLLIFAVFFRKPHIVASTLEFFDREYFRHYAKRLLVPTMSLAAALIFFPSFFYTPVFRFVLYAWTAVHLIGQQFGIIRTMGGGFGRRLDMWKWTALAMGMLLFFGTHWNSTRAVWFENLIIYGSWALLVPFVYLGWTIFKGANTSLGKYYVLANGAMILTCLLFYSSGYFFFVLFVPRIIHDLTGFAFYIPHDVNRNLGKPRNLVYAALSFFQIPIAILCPLIAVLLAFPVTYNLDTDWGYRFSVLITLFHYYTEGFVWKRGSLHRQSLVLS